MEHMDQVNGTYGSGLWNIWIGFMEHMDQVNGMYGSGLWTV